MKEQKYPGMGRAVAAAMQRNIDLAAQAEEDRRIREAVRAEKQRRDAAALAFRPRCTFCRGAGEVLNAATWLDPHAPATAPCTRCGILP